MGLRRSHARLAPCGRIIDERAGPVKIRVRTLRGILARNGLRIGKYVAMLRVL
jgi:hypothetical protein